MKQEFFTFGLDRTGTVVARSACQSMSWTFARFIQTITQLSHCLLLEEVSMSRPITALHELRPNCAFHPFPSAWIARLLFLVACSPEVPESSSGVVVWVQFKCASCACINSVELWQVLQI